MDKKEKRELEDFHKKLLAESWIIMEDEVRKKDREIVELNEIQFQSNFEYERRLYKLEKSIEILSDGRGKLTISEKEWDIKDFQKRIKAKFQNMIQEEIKRKNKKVVELKKGQLQIINKYKRKIYEEAIKGKNILMVEREKYNKKIEELIEINNRKDEEVKEQKLKVKRQNEKIAEMNERLNIDKSEWGDAKYIADGIREIKSKVKDKITTMGG